MGRGRCGERGGGQRKGERNIRALGHRLSIHALTVMSSGHDACGFASYLGSYPDFMARLTSEHTAAVCPRGQHRGRRPETEFATESKQDGWLCRREEHRWSSVYHFFYFFFFFVLVNYAAPKRRQGVLLSPVQRIRRHDFRISVTKNGAHPFSIHLHGPTKLQSGKVLGDVCCWAFKNEPDSSG